MTRCAAVRSPAREWASHRKAGDLVDVRIGVVDTMKELEVELPADVDAEKIQASIDDALADDDKVLWLEDRSGRKLGIPSSKVAYVELGRPDAERRIGFGAG
jgi:hypothetical protein